MDRPGPAWVLLTVVILGLGVIDAWLTHVALHAGVASEANPLMRWCLERFGADMTWSAKIAATVGGCWLLLAHRRWQAASYGLIALAGYYFGVLVVHLQLYF